MLRTRTTFVSYLTLAFGNEGWLGNWTYRIIRFASLAECLRGAVDLLDHLSEVFVQFVETVLQFLGKLVAEIEVSELPYENAKGGTYVLSRS